MWSFWALFHDQPKFRSNGDGGRTILIPAVCVNTIHILHVTQEGFLLRLQYSIPRQHSSKMALRRSISSSTGRRFAPKGDLAEPQYNRDAFGHRAPSP